MSRLQSAASEWDRARRSGLSGGEPEVLPLGFFDRPADAVARELLGAWIVSLVEGVRCSGEIVETEAYVGPHDDASHAAARIGFTSRNAPMFGPAGHAYVYRIYGVHWCLNAVTGAEGYPAAVLIRAARPLEGIEPARERRAGRPIERLLRGPGNLTRGLGVDGELNGHPLDRPPLWIERGTAIADAQVVRGPRIGIARAADWPLRFWIRDNDWVSR